MSEAPASAIRSAVGDRIVQASWAGTAVFAVATLAGLASERAEAVALAVDGVLFATGLAVFLWALAVAADRSRRDEMGIGGLFFLAGDTAPGPVRRRLLGALAVQVVVGVGAASAKPFTALAGGVLVPVYGLALCGLWGAKLGRFAARQSVTRP